MYTAVHIAQWAKRTLQKDDDRESVKLSAILLNKI